MGTISPVLPTLGGARGDGEAAVRDALNTLVTEFNGRIQNVNRDTTETVDLGNALGTAYLGDIDGAKWLVSLGGFSLTFYSDAADTSALAGFANKPYKGRTYRAKFSIGPGGFVKSSYPPYFRAYRSSAASYATGATVVFNAETDPNGWYDNATGIFLPTVAGTYRVSWAVTPLSNLTVDKYLSAKAFTGAGVGYFGSSAYQAGTGTQVTSTGSALVAFNGTTDTMHVRLDNDQGTIAVLNDVGATYFEAEYVGA